MTFSPYIALISAFASQMALLGFTIPLFISLETSHLMVEDHIIPVKSEREGGRKKEEEIGPEKTLCHDWDLNPGPLSPEPSMLSTRPQRPALDLLNLPEGLLATHCRHISGIR